MNETCNCFLRLFIRQSLPDNFSNPSLSLFTPLTRPFHPLAAAVTIMTQEKAKGKAKGKAKEKAEDEALGNSAQEPEELFTGDHADDDYYTVPETGEIIRNPSVDTCAWYMQLGFRSQDFAEWKEHFEEMAKLCQEAMDLREERNALLFDFVEDIRSEQDALFDTTTWRQDPGLSNISQRARERKERDLLQAKQRQQKVVDNFRYNLECQIRNIEDLRAFQGYGEEFNAYLGQQQHSMNTLLEEMALDNFLARCIGPMLHVRCKMDSFIAPYSAPMCIVCFEPVGQDITGVPVRENAELTLCPICGKPYHRTCLTKWRDENPKYDCVVCRPNPRQT